MEYGRYSAPNSQYALVNIPTYNYHSNVNNIYNPNEYKYDTNTVPSFENNYDILGFNTPQEILPYSQKTAEVSPNNYYNFDSYNNINNINNEYNSTSPYEQYFPSSNNLNYDYNFNYQNYDYKNIFNDNSYQNPNSNINYYNNFVVKKVGHGKNNNMLTKQKNSNYNYSEIITYDKYGKIIKKEKKPISNYNKNVTYEQKFYQIKNKKNKNKPIPKKNIIMNNYNNYQPHVQEYNQYEFYPYNQNNNQDYSLTPEIQNLIQNDNSKQNISYENNNQSAFSDEQINKWVKGAESQNNSSNTNFDVTNNNIITTNEVYNSDNNNNSNNNNNNNNNIIDNTNNNIINNSSNQQTTNNTINLTDFLARLPKNYFFFTKGLYNIGSTCYMNSTLQCLFHVSPLISYFLIVYPKDFKSLKKINESVNTQGNLSYAFYDVIKSIFNASKSKQNLSSFSSPTDIITSFDNAISPEKFQKILGKCNPQFKDLEANDSKDLILYLLQTMHQELNYYTKNKPFNKYPNQYNRAETYMTFINSYDITNYSIISYLFYGTSENTTKCDNCKNIIYNFQKFEFLSFGVAKYDGKEFNIMNGFDDHIKKEKLTGDNQYYCNYCKKLCDADIQSKIIFPPKYLLINIDYGKNKKFMPSSVKYSEEIDITKYINFDFKKQIKYRILGVCSHLGVSGISGHYISFCKNKKTGKWYNFNDSIVSICNSISEIINYGNPYLLLYEQI